MQDAPVMTRERLDALARNIADLALRIDLAKQFLFRDLRQFDIGLVAAREHVRVARALGELRRVDAAFGAGQLSYSKVRAITRVATPATEQDFLDIAAHATASQIETIAAAYRRTRVDPAASADPNSPTADLRRFVRRTDTPSGMVRIELQLAPEQANVVWQAMFAALDAGRSSTEASPAVAPANASAEASASTAASADASAESDPALLQAERADALVSVAQAYLQHSPRTLGSGYELVVMTTPAQLEHGPGGVGGFLRDGTPVPLHVARMLACDCSRVDVEVGESGEILDVGRARRTIPSAIGRALWLRDGGCRVPGCGRKHHLHAHHIEAWAQGGKTAAANLVLLCPSHHALVHEGQLFVDVVEGRVEFRNACGIGIRPAPERGEDREAAELWLRSQTPGFDCDGVPRWDGSRLDLDEVLSWMAIAERSRPALAA